ncbi:MAG: type II toxin-antitoxin system Phd/YefM family antitoxin [Hormoscilla sp. GUM202]|nr:type II toxin-antitoxin system Phd/YefM family antitoxin [Hormoscilla sp. GUM202]
MKKVPVTEIKARFSDYLKEADGNPIVITENDRPVATMTLVVDPEEIESLMLASNPRFNQLMDAAKQRIEATGGIEHDEFWKLVEQSE